MLTRRLVEEIRLRNLTKHERLCSVVLRVDADFADVFAVKEGRARPGWRTIEARGSSVMIRGRQPTDAVRITVVGAGAAYGPDGIQAIIKLGPSATAVLTATVQPTGKVRDGDLQIAAPTRPFRVPALRTRSASVAATLRRSGADIESLRIVDPADPTRVAVAAGAPWFMALFGRDSLLTAYMSLPMDQELALGTLRMLAARQGRRTDPLTEEQPGRILHEARFGRDAALALGGRTTYYGTVDATPLFVMLLAEMWRWGASPDDVIELLPHADRALLWCRRHADADEDGFIQYRRATEHGMVNQGWKDSWNGITHSDGSLAKAPIALCEVQGYHYAALLGRAEIAEGLGDTRSARRLTARAQALQERFDERYWLDDLVLLRVGSGRRQTTGRRAGIQPGAPALDGHRPSRASRAPSGTAPLPRDVQRLGRAHPGNVDGGVQPGQLPQRIGVAARQRDRGARTGQVWPR